MNNGEQKISSVENEVLIFTLYVEAAFYWLRARLESIRIQEIKTGEKSWCWLKKRKTNNWST